MEQLNNTIEDMIKFNNIAKCYIKYYHKKLYPIMFRKHYFLCNTFIFGNNVNFVGYFEDCKKYKTERSEIIKQFIINVNKQYKEDEKKKKLKLLMKTNKLSYDVVYYEINKFL